LVPILPGDYNGDGRVDAGDYVRWRNSLGDADESNIQYSGDGGGVTIDDYAWWKLHYGNNAGEAGGGSLSAATPEPSTLLMSLASWTGFAAIVRRRFKAKTSAP
jgi:hypothetical protein